MQLHNHNQLRNWLEQHAGAMIYFSAEQCPVCHVLKPRLEAMVNEHFPAITSAEIRCHETPELAAQLGIFTVPALLVFFDQKEVYRKAGLFSLPQVSGELSRSYQIFFGQDV